MVAVDLIEDAFLLTLILAIVRWAQTKISSESTTGKALAWIYH
jgi:hypothetical protein